MTALGVVSVVSAVAGAGWGGPVSQYHELGSRARSMATSTSTSNPTIDIIRS
ncbi:MAG: hypothetical protein CM1200mP2_44990 [Planctomycetaceae bacterium]|nr:MAG: hypothetical protein CM1200mP2_44990 [Planctomycetaceae bacterium]